MADIPEDVRIEKVADRFRILSVVTERTPEGEPVKVLKPWKEVSLAELETENEAHRAAIAKNDELAALIAGGKYLPE